LFFGQAGVADAADFGAGDSDVDVAVAGDLFFELFVETGFKFADFAAAKTGDMNVIARAVGFVIVAIAAEVEEVEFIDEALALEEIDGAVDGDEVDFGIDLLGAFENLVDIEMLLGGIHDLENDAALASDTDAALAESGLKMAGRFGRVDAFARRDASRWRGGHGADASKG
jgi:hypothetical protein